jgi:hypothetical protein
MLHDLSPQAAPVETAPLQQQQQQYSEPSQLTQPDQQAWPVQQQQQQLLANGSTRQLGASLSDTPQQQQQQEQQGASNGSDGSASRRDDPLLASLQRAGSYPALSRLVSQHSRAFQPHHTAAAVLRLAQIVAAARCAPAAQQPQQPMQPPPPGGPAAAAAAAAAVREDDGYDGEAGWSGSLDAPHLHGLSAGGSPPSSAAASSSSSAEEGDAGVGFAGISPSSPSTGLQLRPFIRGRGLAGLIPVAGSSGVQPGSSTAAAAAAAAAADAAASGLLDAATMAARMAAVRQQQAEQAALARSENWRTGQRPGQQQQQQQWQLPAGAQVVVCYDALLSALLDQVVRQARGMSASSGLAVLTGIALLQAPHRCVTRELAASGQPTASLPHVCATAMRQPADTTQLIWWRPASAPPALPPLPSPPSPAPAVCWTRCCAIRCLAGWPSCATAALSLCPPAWRGCSTAPRPPGCTSTCSSCRCVRACVRVVWWAARARVGLHALRGCVRAPS